MSLSPSPSPSPMLLGQHTRKMDSNSTTTTTTMTTTETTPRRLHYHAATLSALEGYRSPPPTQEPQPVSQFDFDTSEEEEEGEEGERETDRESSKPNFSRPIATLRLGRLRRENLHVLHQRVESSPGSSARASSAARADARDVSRYAGSRPVSRARSMLPPQKSRPTSSVFTFGRQSEALMAAEDFVLGPLYAVEPGIHPTQLGPCQRQYQHQHGHQDIKRMAALAGAQDTPTSLKRSATEPKKKKRRQTLLYQQRHAGLTGTARRRRQPREGLEALDEAALAPSAQDSDSEDLSCAAPPPIAFAPSNRLSMPVTGREHASVRSLPKQFIAISEAAERDAPVDNVFASTQPGTGTGTGTGKGGAGQRGAEMESRAEEAVAARKRFGSVDHSGWDAALAALSLSPSPTPGEEHGHVGSPNSDSNAALAQGEEARSPNYNPEEDEEEEQDELHQQTPPPPPIPVRKRGRRSMALTLSLGGDRDSNLYRSASRSWPTTTALQHSSTRYDDHDPTPPGDLVSTACRRYSFPSLPAGFDDMTRLQRVADFASADAADAAAAEALMQRQSATVGSKSEPALRLSAPPSAALAQELLLSHSYPALEAQLTPRHGPADEAFSRVGPDIQAWRHSLLPAATTTTTTTTAATPSELLSSVSRATTGTGAETEQPQQPQPRIGIRSAPFSSSSSSPSFHGPGAGSLEQERRRRGGGGAPQRLKRLTMRILGRALSGTNNTATSENNHSNGSSQDRDHIRASRPVGGQHPNRSSSYQNDSGYGGSSVTTDARDHRNHSTETTATQIKFQDCALPPPGERPPQPRSRRPSGYPDLDLRPSFSHGGGGPKGGREVGRGGGSRLSRARVRLSRMFH